jgi:hypothetical protein
MMVSIGCVLICDDFFVLMMERFFCGDDGERLLQLKVRKRCHRIELTRVSSRAVIPCEKPKSNRNNNGEKYFER